MLSVNIQNNNTILTYKLLAKMEIKASEIFQLLEVAPKGIYGMIGRNLGIPRRKILNELRTFKKEYDQDIAVELKRLVEAINLNKVNIDITN